MTYPKRTIDLEEGDVVCMYGARERVVRVEYVKPDARYTAVMVLVEDVSSGVTRHVCYDNQYVPVALMPGYKVVAVPIEVPA